MKEKIGEFKTSGGKNKIKAILSGAGTVVLAVLTKHLYDASQGFHTAASELFDIAASDPTKFGDWYLHRFPYYEQKFGYLFGEFWRRGTISSTIYETFWSWFGCEWTRPNIVKIAEKIDRTAGHLKVGSYCLATGATITAACALVYGARWYRNRQKIRGR